MGREIERAEPLAEPREHALHLSRIRVSHRVGDAHPVGARFGVLLGQRQHCVFVDLAFDGAAERGGNAAAELNTAPFRVRIPQLDDAGEVRERLRSGTPNILLIEAAKLVPP